MILLSRFMTQASRRNLQCTWAPRACTRTPSVAPLILFCPELLKWCAISATHVSDSRTKDSPNGDLRPLFASTGSIDRSHTECVAARPRSYHAPPPEFSSHLIGMSLSKQQTSNPTLPNESYSVKHAKQNIIQDTKQSGKR